MAREPYKYTGEVAARLLGPGAVSIGQDVYKSDLTRTFIQLTLLHSFPKVNSNGVTLMPPMLAKAAPTANSQPLDLDHQLEGNDDVYEGTDQVVGAMLKAYLANEDELTLLPDAPIPVKVIGVLWNRIAMARDIINSIGQDEKQYSVSFEILRDVSEDGWVVFGENGPSYEAAISEELFESWKRKEYDKVAAALGGDGSGNSANIWGGGFTLTPADKDANITAILTGSFNGQCAIAGHLDTALASVIPYKKFPKADEDAAWSFPAAAGNALLGENKDNWARYRSVHSWYDSENPEKKGSYKLPVAKEVDGTIKVFWHGVRAAMGILLGARGGVAIPADNKKAVYSRLKKYYKDFDKEVPEYGSYTDAQLAAMGFDMAAIASCLEAENANEEVTTMSFKAAPAKLRAAIAQGGFQVQVVGNDLTLTLGENVIKNPPDFYLSRWTRGDGEPSLHASMEIAVGGIDGFKEMKRLEYVADAENEADSMSPVEEGSEKVKTPSMYEAQISALLNTIKDGKTDDQIRAEFADYLSPDDHQKAVDKAVAKALAEAGSDNLFTEEQLNAKVQESIKEILETRDTAEAVAKARGEKLVGEGLPLTEERKISIAAIPVGDEGDAAFDKWLASLTANQEIMVKDLESAKINVTEQVKAALAHINSPADSGYAALVASQGGDPTPAFTPSMPAAGGGAGSEPNSAAGCF